jgi:predicted  nucleic acid-binding Zn-ribbon protein
MDELSSLEKLVGLFVQKCDDLFDKNIELNNTVLRLEQENQALKNKIKEIEDHFSNAPEQEDIFDSSSLGPEERKEIKNKIGELISKLDNHLRS